MGDVYNWWAVETEAEKGHGTIAVTTLLEALDAIGKYELGYGEGACRTVRAAAELIRQLGTDVDGNGSCLDLENAEVTW